MHKRILMVAAVLGGAVLMSRGLIFSEPAEAETVNDGASQRPENTTATNSPGLTRAPAAGNTVAPVGTAMDPPAVSNNTVAAVSNNTVAAVTDDSSSVGPRIGRESMHPEVAESPHPEIEHHAAGVGGGTPPTTGTPGFVGAAPLVTPVPSGGGGGVPASRS